MPSSPTIAMIANPIFIGGEAPCDFSLQVLAILQLLLNVNKAAKDIIAIPRVQVVP